QIIGNASIRRGVRGKASATRQQELVVRTGQGAALGQFCLLGVGEIGRGRAARDNRGVVNEESLIRGMDGENILHHGLVLVRKRVVGARLAVGIHDAFRKQVGNRLSALRLVSGEDVVESTILPKDDYHVL